MKRLTFDGNFCDIAMCQETRGGSFCEDGYCTQRKVWERLKNYEDAEEQGLLVRLPCKVGDTVYWVTAIEDCEQCKHYDGITNMDDWECLAEECPQRIVKCKFELGDLRLIEKTVFLTREAAEKAFKDA